MSREKQGYEQIVPRPSAELASADVLSCCRFESAYRRWWCERVSLA